MVKNLSAMQETQVSPWVEKIPWRREWLPNPVFLPGEFHGQRSLGPQRVRHDGATNTLSASTQGKAAGTTFA